MKKILLCGAISLMTLASANAGIVNNGAKIVVTSGTYVVNTGNLTDTGNDAVINNKGTIKVGGDIAHNAPNTQMFTSSDKSGTVEFTKTGTQTVSGTSSQQIAFDNLIVSASSNASFSDIGATLWTSLTLNGKMSVGTSDINLEGSLTGSGKVTAINTGFFAQKPTQNVPMVFPMSDDGTKDYKVTVTCSGTSAGLYGLKINNDKSVNGEALIDFWDFSCAPFWNATVTFRVPRTAFVSGEWKNSNQIRYFDGSRYIPIPENNISVVVYQNYVEITVTGHEFGQLQG